VDDAPPAEDVAGPTTPSDDIGARLLGLVAEARAAGVDPEQALRDAVRGLLAD
jgi:XTP/dITP diphosphohydrolase